MGFEERTGARNTKPIMTTAVRVWIWLSAWLCGAGWVLSAAHQLNARGYLLALVPTAAVLAWQLQKTKLPSSVIKFQKLPRKMLRRFRRLAPLLFLALTFVSLVGALAACPQNGDTNAYRLPRVLQWLTGNGWYWIHTADSRMNIAANGYEWLFAPLVLVFRTDRWIHLPNLLSFLLLPGLVFSVLRRMGVRPRVAWWWMWLLPTGWCFIQQACSTVNDLLGAVYVLAAVDFALRARESKSVRDVWLSLLAAALMTGVKQTNLPLLLPWFIAVWPSLPLLLRQPGSSGAVTLLALLASFVPMAWFNWKYTGSWMGFPKIANAPDLTGQPLTWGAQETIHSPFWGLLGNMFCLPLQNLCPPFFPLAPAWNHLMQRFLLTPLGAHFAPFEMFGHLSRTMSDNAGIGVGITVLILISLIWWGHRTIGAGPPDRFLQMLRWAPWLALLVFMAKVVTYGNARTVAPYYALLLPWLLTRQGQTSLTRRRWWQVLVLLVMLFSVVFMTYARGRELIPGTVVTWLLDKYPHAKYLSVLNNYYLAQASLAARKDFAHRRILEKEKVIGYATTSGGEEPTISLPLGSRQVRRVLATDTVDQLRSEGIHYVIVEQLALQSANQTLSDWLARYDGTLVDELSFVVTPGEPLRQLYLVRISPAASIP